jgi:endonuclease/exonuclease/phosphatase family metal-dependent hydrolase
MSRFPSINKNTVFTRGDYNATLDLVDGDYNMRNLQHVELDNNGKPLHILNHHGHHVKQHKNGNDETLRQCGIIAEYIKNLKGGIVLTGDFNLAPESESLEKLNDILINHSKLSGVTTTRTLLTDKTEVCDYIFTSRELPTNNFRIISEIVSDHAALVIEIV